jgi:hypothetical protein
MNRRRFVLLAGVTVAAPAAVARAQTAPVPMSTPGGCTVGFVNGLLQIAPDCPLLTPPGTQMAVAPPSHLAMPDVDEAAAQAAMQAAEDEDLLRLQNKRDKKRTKKGRRGDQQREQRRRATARRRKRHAPPVPTPTPTPTPKRQAGTAALVNG